MSKQIVAILTKEFGPDRIKVNTPHHVQVKSGTAGMHDVWFGSEGMKLRLAGSKQVQQIRTSQLVKQIQRYDPKISDLAAMQDAAKFTEFIRKAASFKTNGIFVDAGWKDGKAKIAVIWIEGERIAGESYVAMDHPDANSAELAAIEKGLKYNPFNSPVVPPVYSDCMAAINKIANPRVQWVNRDNNISDKIGNMRSRP